jgi:response regulator of citrate/malate metabolism
MRQAEDQRGIAGEVGAKIVVVTSSTESKTILQSFRAGCAAFVSKPFDVEKFKAQLREFGLLKP